MMLIAAAAAVVVVLVSFVAVCRSGAFLYQLSSMWI